MHLNDKLNEHSTEQDIEKVLPDFLLRTAHKINSKNRVIIQGAIQKYIDHSISSTINLPEDVEPEIISDIYFDAWKENLKGVTIYREGSRYPILSTNTEIVNDFQKIKNNEYTILDDGEERKVMGDDVLKLPNGSLTTVYHYMNIEESSQVMTVEKEKGIKA